VKHVVTKSVVNDALLNFDIVRHCFDIGTVVAPNTKVRVDNK